MCVFPVWEALVLLCDDVDFGGCGPRMVCMDGGEGIEFEVARFYGCIEVDFLFCRVFANVVVGEFAVFDGCPRFAVVGDGEGVGLDEAVGKVGAGCVDESGEFLFPPHVDGEGMGVAREAVGVGGVPVCFGVSVDGVMGKARIRLFG